jgi:hypothetical protein
MAAADDKNKVHIENDLLVFLCPHCEMTVEVKKSEMNCRVFRHGYHTSPDKKQLLSQVNPHASKEECEKILAEGNVVGCCRPFQITGDDANMRVEVCEYI